MRLSFSILFLAVSFVTWAQFVPDPKSWIEQLNLKGSFPEKILSSRTAVFYDYFLTQKELSDTQQQFQQSGIDAVVYFELDMVMAGKDVTRTFGQYLLKREITNLIFIEKNENDYRITATVFNGKENVVDPTQSAWSVSNKTYADALKQLYLTISSQQKKQNLLINEMPETGMSVNPIIGKRNEFFAIDAKVDPLAVPKTGDPAVDAELEEIFKSNYSLKYKLTAAGNTGKRITKAGIIVCSMRGTNARHRCQGVAWLRYVEIGNRDRFGNLSGHSATTQKHSIQHTGV